MKKIIITVVLFALWSCKETIVEEDGGTTFYFDSPQPANDFELSSFPLKFRGVYIIGDTELHIDKKDIYYAYLEDGKFAKAEMDSLKSGGIIYEKNELILKEGKHTIVYNTKEEKDSIYFFRRRNDTIFKLSSTQKAKRINGQLILSTKDSVFWDVKMLTIEKDSLRWTYLTYKEDYLALKPIVKKMSINVDTTIVHLWPTRKELGKIMQLETLKSNKYKRIK